VAQSKHCYSKREEWKDRKEGWDQSENQNLAEQTLNPVTPSLASRACGDMIGFQKSLGSSPSVALQAGAHVAFLLG
jgi:hypothetical protein